MLYNVDENYYGEFGGAYIPKCYTQMLKNYAKNKKLLLNLILRLSLIKLLKVGWLAHSIFATTLSEKQYKIYLKKKILNHTEHKIQQ
jgi:tryptophan synthase beta subunit